jgi:uncharacterized tellurite resistance protein B-like protein
MFQGLSERLSAWFSGEDRPREPDPAELRLAAAVLLVHAATIDGRLSETEAERLRELLRDRFDLSPDETHELLIAAERREKEAIDLYSFTSRLKQLMSEEERQGLIFMMWEIVYADGELDPLEDNLIWRAAELLGVSSRDRMLMKKRAAFKP